MKRLMEVLTVQSESYNQGRMEKYVKKIGRVALKIARERSGFFSNQHACSDIPVTKTVTPETIKPTGTHVSKVQCCAT